MSRIPEVVVVLHGLGRSPLSMLRLAQALRREGYAVKNWGYKSFVGGIEDKVTDLRLRLLELKGYTKVHAVGHSLGGLILRGLLTEKTGLPLGRIVFLGTPHKGASVINRNPALFNHKRIPRIIRELEADSPAIAALGLPPMEIGVVAGVEQLSPFNPVSWLNRRVLGDELHDGTVEVASARLDGQMKDYLEVPVNHSFLPLSRKVIDPTVHFIRKGKFR
jgi:pimeloyl-ACP methyl ester carboxylesterase